MLWAEIRYLIYHRQRYDVRIFGKVYRKGYGNAY